VTAVGAITELHWVNNYSSSALTITNLEPDPAFAATCPPGRSTFIAEQWVPWCSRGSDFAAHHIVITLAGVTFFVWQDTDSDGNWVRLSTDGYTSSSIPPEFIPAEHFPGSALEGGGRNVEVSPGGALRLVNA
jgi:hypothetical protein